MRKPRDRHPKFKEDDKVLHKNGQTGVIINGWWDEVDDFRYVVDFKYGRSDRKLKGEWIIKESSLKGKE